MITFKSILNADKMAYQLDSEWAWNSKGNAPLSLYLKQFDTYGDGTTQHSNSWCVQWADLTDACLSLTAAIVADPLNEAWKQLAYMFTELSPESYAFFQSIKYREDKEQWYSVSERKVSSAPSKRNDRRWEKVESWMDSKPSSILSIALNAQPGLDWLQKLCVADDLRTALGYPCWEDYFKATAELKGDWHQAFCACRAGAKAIQQLGYAKRALDSALYNSTKPQAEPVAA